MSGIDRDQTQGGFDAPLVIVFAGPNGSGKSTVNARVLQDPELNFVGEYINADDIAKSLTGQITNALERNVRAAEMAGQRRQQAMRDGRPFAFETVMSTPEKVAIMTQAKARGYDVSLVFITTDDPEKNVRRVADRVAKGGHPVAPDAIRRRYHSTMALLPCAVEHADVALIVDNSRGRPLDVALKADGVLHPVATHPPRWVAEKLIAPYRERARSRGQIGQAFTAHCAGAASAARLAVLQDADASHGKTYRGSIIAVTPYHVLQGIEGNRFVIHDRSLSAPQALRQDESAVIGYAYDKGKIVAPAPDLACGQDI